MSVHYDLTAVFATGSVDEFLEHLRRAIGGRPWPQVTDLTSPAPWRPDYGPTPESNLEALLETIRQATKDPASVRVGFGELSSLRWGRRPDCKTIHLAVVFSPPDNVFADPADCVRAPTHVLRRLLQQGAPIAEAAIERKGDAGTCIPFVPLAKTRRPAVLTSDEEVEREYDRVEDFWSAGWRIEPFGKQKLLTRCQDVVSLGDILSGIRDHQWQMARAAKPGRTKYGHPTIAPEEKEVYEEGEARIYPVGLHRKIGVVQYSCVLEPGEHLHGWEIFYLRSLVAEKKMQDGTPVSGVRVVFLEPWMAESEKRPLLDNGVQVLYEDANTGDLVAIEQ